MRPALCCLLVAAFPALAGFGNFSSVPGGIAGVLLEQAGEQPPRAFFGNSPTLVSRYPAGFVAVVGLPLDLAPGFYVINAVDSDEHHESYTFAVKASRRPIQSIVLPPGISAQSIVAAHARRLAWIPEDIPAESEPDFDFVLPSPVPITRQFGWIHLTGTGHTLPYPGIGLDHSASTPLRSPSFGQVTEIGEEDDAYRVVIAHGAGLVSVFHNVDEVSVSPQDWVPKGAEFGRMQKSDRVTLVPDWSVFLNRTRIDPLLLVSSTVSLDDATAPLAAPR